jgi:hypothetical protein
VRTAPELVEALDLDQARGVDRPSGPGERRPDFCGVAPSLDVEALPWSSALPQCHGPGTNPHRGGYEGP